MSVEFVEIRSSKSVEPPKQILLRHNFGMNRKGVVSVTSFMQKFQDLSNYLLTVLSFIKLHIEMFAGQSFIAFPTSNGIEF